MRCETCRGEVKACDSCGKQPLDMQHFKHKETALHLCLNCTTNAMNDYKALDGIREKVIHNRLSPLPLDDREIRIYATKTSADCVQAREFFDQNGIPYTEFNVYESKDALEQVTRLTGKRIVPVIVCGNDVVVGFNRLQLGQLVERIKSRAADDR
jgi:glutaredoxin